MIDQPQLIEWGIAQTAYQAPSGDGYVIESSPNRILIAVIDGLGHGPKAAIAADAAVEALKFQVDKDPFSLMQRCHQALIGTRGAVLSLASFDITQDTMTWLGVGNVTGVLLRGNGTGNSTREHLHLRGGVVGYRLPTLRAFTAPVNAGDTLIFVTDGIRSNFLEDIRLTNPPQQIADHILEYHSRGTDDALVFVSRYKAQPL